MKNNVRDFIYLDQSRVLSIGSQLMGGITESIVEKEVSAKTNQNALSLKGGVTGELAIGDETSGLLQTLIANVFKTKLNLSGEASPNFVRINSNNIESAETKILNHYQFSLLIDALKENKLLKDLDIYKPHEWKPRGKVVESLKPGDFIELTCRTKIEDVSYLGSVASALEKFIEMMNQVKAAEMVKVLINEGRTADEALQLITDTPVQFGLDSMKGLFGADSNPLEINAIISLMKEMVGGGLTNIPLHITVRSKSASEKDVKFIGPINESFLIDTKQDLLFKYGFSPDQDWRLLAQVCKIPKEERTDSVSFPQVAEGKIDQMVQCMTDMFTQLSSQIGVHSTVLFPNISINVIALYRL